MAAPVPSVPGKSGLRSPRVRARAHLSRVYYPHRCDGARVRVADGRHPLYGVCMAATREQAQKGAALTNVKQEARVQARRLLVASLLKSNPGLTAEKVAVQLHSSPTRIRADWRALRRGGTDTGTP